MNKLSFWEVVKLLWDYKSWKFVPVSGYNLFERIEHENGYWYYYTLNCISLRNNKDEVIYDANPFIWGIFHILCARLEGKIECEKEFQP